MPSFPTALADAGEVRGLRGRGDFQADIVWNRGKVSLLVLRFSTEVHPWFTAEIIREQYNSSGFYHVSTSQHNSGSGYYGRSNISSVVYSIKVASPNILRMIDALHTSDAVVDPCFRWSAFNASGSPLKYAHRSHWTKNLSLRRLDILKLPCIVHLCGSHVGEVSCTNLRDQNLQQLP